MTITIFFTTYKADGPVQKRRKDDMVKMLVKLMIQLSFVESRHWKEWIQILDPAFNVPTVQTINFTLLLNKSSIR